MSKIKLTTIYHCVSCAIQFYKNCTEQCVRWSDITLIEFEMKRKSIAA